MRITSVVLVLLTWNATRAGAQSRPVYLGTSIGGNVGSRGPVDVGAVRTGGGVVGIRLSEAWSIEIEADRGFGSSRRDDGESFWVSYAPSGSSREEIERVAVRASFVRIDEAREGFAALVVWKDRGPGRLNAALYGGVAQRNFDKRVIRTITHVPEDAGIPVNDPNVHDADETRTFTGGGLTAGAMILGRVSDAITIAPDFRFTWGFITDEGRYRIFSAGVRLLWGF